jgi:OFA family oxalate/formate antiporter-like MFS transporter
MKIHRYAILVAGSVLLLFAGVIYAWSILRQPFIDDFGWGENLLGANFTLTMCCFVGGGMFGGMMLKKTGSRAVLRIAAALVFAGFVLTSRLEPDKIFLLYIAYGALCGFGIGIVYNVTISSVTKLFPDKNATVSGILMMSFGVSTLVLGSVAGVLMKGIGWRTFFIVLASAMAVVFVLGSLVMPRREDGIAAENADDAEPPSVPDIPTGKMMRLSVFRKFYIYQILISGIGAGVIGIAKGVSVSVGNAETFAILIVGVFSVCNGIGRILSGFLFDHIGRRKTMLIGTALALLGSVTCLVSVILVSAPLNTAGFVILGLTYGFMPPLTSGYIKSMFGSKYFPMNFSVANSMLMFASFTTTIGGGIYASSGNYVGVFILFVCFALAGTGMFLSLRKKI